MRRFTFWADEDLSARLKIAAAAAHTTPSKLLRQFIAWGFDRLVADGVIQRATSNWQPALAPDTDSQFENHITDEDPSPDHFRRRLVLSRRASIKARLTALRNMKRPSLSFLLKLLNPRSKTPSELYLAATELYAYALERQKLARKHAKETKSTQPR